MSLFSTQIYTSTAIPFRHLFHEDLDKYYTSNKYLNESNIYFLARIKKIRFLVEKTRMLADNTIGFYLQCSGGEDIYTEKLIFDVSTSARALREYASSEFEFSFEELFQFEINYEKSTPESLEINILFIGNETERESFQIDVFQVWGDDESINLDNYPEIVYVGQSKNILKRFRSHSTVLKAVSGLSDSEELVHYFITFKIGYGGHKDDIKADASIMSLVMNMDRKSEDYWELIDVLERVLIYFYQPKLNELHMKTPIEQDSKIQKLLRKDGIKGVSVGVGVYGDKHKFWSPGQKLKEEIFSYHFDSPEKGFTKGINNNLMGF